MNIDILDSAYIVWERTPTNDILFKRNTISFDPLIDIGDGDSPRAAPAVAASGNNVHVVWRSLSGGRGEIVYRRSTDGGGDVRGGSGNLSSTVGESSAPAVAASGNNVYVVWSDNSPGNFEILYRRSTDGGASFGDTVNISDASGSAGPPNTAPAVAASGNNVYVVWGDHGRNISYRRSTDGGADFGSTVHISNDFESTFNPAVAASNNLT
jgi:hypothetical protein